MEGNINDDDNGDDDGEIPYVDTTEIEKSTDSLLPAAPCAVQWIDRWFCPRRGEYIVYVSVWDVLVLSWSRLFCGTTAASMRHGPGIQKV